MSQLTIICPHCEFSKSVEKDRIPPGVKSIKCPKCQQSFTFTPTQETAPGIALAEIQPIETPPARPSPPPPSPSSRESFESSATFKYCETCGRKISLQAEVCPGCRTRVATPAKAVSKVALLLITFFLGGMGGHRFYQKKYLLGTLYLLFFWTYIPGLVAFIEFIIYAVKSEEELQQQYPEAGNAAIIAVAFVFLGIVVIGILAAIAIPQFAAYRQKAFDAAARNDLAACNSQVEAYLATQRAYPTVAGQLSCPTSQNVALYYFSGGSDKYQLVSFHDRGETAFLLGSSDIKMSESPREEIEQQIRADFGQSALAASFHFVE